jgi:hypothetical protein
MTIKTRVRSRSRWAAVGAAVAVTLDAGSLVAVNAGSSDPSSFVAITPARVLDTRTDVGLAGPFVSGVPRTLQVTGTVPIQTLGGVAAVATEVVPVVASSVVFNVTVIKPVTNGFLSIRPGDAGGDPATSNINWAAGGANIANAVTINIFVNGTVGHVLIDVAGYNVPGGTGADGVQGIRGTNGANGADGVPVRRYGRTITSLSTVDNTATHGLYTSIAVGADAKPTVRYFSEAPNNERVDRDPPLQASWLQLSQLIMLDRLSVDRRHLRPFHTHPCSAPQRLLGDTYVRP